MAKIKVIHNPDFTGHLARPDAPTDYRPPTDFPDISQAKQITLDFETHDPDLKKKGPGVYRGAYIVGAGINADGQYKAYYPLRHADGPNCDPEKTIQWLRDNLNNFKGEIVGANSNLYDGDFAQAAGIRPTQAKWRDVQWAESLIDEYSDSYALDALGEKYLGEHKKTNKLVELYGPDVMKNFREVHPAHATEYAMWDIDSPPRILEKQIPVLKSEKLYKLFDMEARLTPVLLYMREHGVRVDLNKAEKLREKLLVEEAGYSQRLQELAGYPINFNAPAQIAQACDDLFIDYPRTKPTKKHFTGQPSFKKDWLKAQPYELLKVIADARGVNKARKTFLEGYILNGNINGRIHCQFNPVHHIDDDSEDGAKWGRFSSSNPNLQNIPIRSELGKLIRSCFIPENGMLWGALDFSQIEYRYLIHYASLTGCTDAEIAREMYLNDPNTDFYTLTAQLTGLPRNDAKVLALGLAYGMGVWKLAKSLGQVNPDGSPNERALEIMEIHHEKAPFIKELYNMSSDQAQKKGFVKTILGRRARFDLWEPRKYQQGVFYPPLPFELAQAEYGEDIRRYGTHKSLNRILQGSAADLMKKCLVDLWESGLLGGSSPLTLHVTVHDELGFSVEPGARGEKYFAEVRRLMANAIPLRVPVLVSGDLGKNWAEAK